MCNKKYTPPPSLNVKSSIQNVAQNICYTKMDFLDVMLSRMPGDLLLQRKKHGKSNTQTDMRILHWLSFDTEFIKQV